MISVGSRVKYNDRIYTVRGVASNGGVVFAIWLEGMDTAIRGKQLKKIQVVK